MPLCNVCQDDGWIAYPTWANPAKTKVRIRKVICPRGCPLANPDEPGVLAAYPEHEDREEGN